MRDRDELFDALVNELGINPAELTRSARGRINCALKELREVHATPVQIRDRSREYRKRFDGAAFTATALAAHWPGLGPKYVTMQKAEDYLHRLLVEHEHGEPGVWRKADVYAKEKLTAEQRRDPAISSILARFAQSWRIVA